MNKGRTKISLFALNCGSIDVLTRMFIVCDIRNKY